VLRSRFHFIHLDLTTSGYHFLPAIIHHFILAIFMRCRARNYVLPQKPMISSVGLIIVTGTFSFRTAAETKMAPYCMLFP
jgi:hypothetical protein